MKKIINDPADFVDEFLDGILLAYPRQYRAASPDGRALVRADAPRLGKVGIVTGGGSGHLPAFLGYVGPGLCDGVAVGNVFSSPSPEQIYAATRAVSGGAGVLYLYGNYGGDIYNFDLAADLADVDGIATRTVLAMDDVASAPADNSSSRRGVAGMVFAFKLAGAAAERGDDLEQVAAIAGRVAAATRTMGVGLSPTILPAAGVPTFVLPDGEMEIGVGIHGEPGVHRGKLEPSRDIAARLVEALLPEVPKIGKTQVALLINGAGSTPLEELFVLYRDVDQLLQAAGAQVYKPMIGNFVTSLEMAGASISVLPLDDDLVALLDAPAESPFFRSSARELADAAVLDGRDATRTTEALATPGEPTRLWTILMNVLARMPQHADQLRDLDAALGDGDLGITVSAGSTAALTAIESHPSESDAATLRRVGSAFASANPSTFAALIGGGVIHAASQLGDSDMDELSLPPAVRALADRISTRGGAVQGDKTVLDALIATMSILERGPHADTLDHVIQAVEAVITRMTPEQSKKGRAAWLRERSAGLQDPGMTAYLLFLVELREALDELGSS